MAELVQSVQDMLKEETWTRATISNYTQNNLKEFANIVEKAHSENCADEIYDICHTQKTVLLLFISAEFLICRKVHLIILLW